MDVKLWLRTQPFWWRERGVSVYLVDGLAVAVRTFRGVAPVVLCRVPVLGLSAGEAFTAIEEGVFMALEKGAVRRVAGAKYGGLLAGDFGVLYPMFFEHLSRTAWDDGSVRVPSSFLVFNDGGCLKLMLRDREENLCLWMAGVSVDELFQLTEEALNSSETEWRVDRQSAGDVASRKRKK